MSDMFYRAFEDRHRGSRELILSRLRAYLPFLQPLLEQAETDLQAFDFGCGRGEWLELIRAQGFSATGIDIDDGMLSSCQELGLQTVKADAIEYLQAMAPDSCVLVSAFHVVEHIPFEALRQFVDHALRVLKPGGLLIMETPNPENIVVATRNFYLDPTHQKPIPAELLSFVADYAGFQRVKILGLQEPENLASKPSIDLHDVFHGVSPDYAVVAQKGASAAIMGEFTDVFERDFGITLDTLLARSDQRAQRIEQLADQAHTRAEAAESKASQAESKAEAAEGKASQAEAKADGASAKATQCELVAADAQAAASEFAARLNAEIAYVNALKSSTSWRVTAPLRYVSSSVRTLKPAEMRGRMGLLARHGALYVGRRPRLRAGFLLILNRFPTLKSRLRRLAFVPIVSPIHARNPDLTSAQLTPRGQEIHSDLKAAIASKKTENG